MSVSADTLVSTPPLYEAPDRDSVQQRIADLVAQAPALSEARRVRISAVLTSAASGGAA